MPTMNVPVLATWAICSLADLPKGKFELVAENEQHVEKWLLNHVSNLLLAFNHAQISR